MSDTIKCPVCGKAGIPDYHSEDTICPQCGSDLSIFRVIDRIPEPHHSKSNPWLPIAVVAIIVAVLMGGYMLLRPAQVSQNVIGNDRLAELTDSINRLNAQLADTNTSEINSINSGFDYIIRKGDSFWSISKRFYGTGTRYEEIARENGLDANSKLTVGDTIKIK